MAHETTLIAVRARNHLDLLDLALVVVRSRPWPLLAAALAGVLPFALLDAWLIRDPAVSPWAFLLLLPLEAPWATAPLTVVLGGLMIGQRPPAKRVAGTLLRSLWGVFLYQGLLRAVLLVSIVLSPLIPGRLAFTNEILLLEKGKVSAVFKRNALLCGEFGFEMVFYWLVHLAASFLFVAGFWIGASGFYNVLTTGQPVPWLPDDADLRGPVFQSAAWLCVAFFAVARFLCYLDRRIRLEGWEVEFRLRQVGKVMEDQEQW